MPGFTDLRWQQMTDKLNDDPERWGCPVRRDDSVVIGSFNALKLGKDNNSDKRWEFLERFVSRFDLIAIQEVMDDLSGIRRLQRDCGSKFELLVSDTTGAAPGDGGLKERLAFLYHRDRIELKELVSDITYDRSNIAKNLHRDIDLWTQFFKDFDDTNAARVAQGKKKISLSKKSLPAFLDFIRTPHCAAFVIKGKGSGDDIEFLALNAHTLYGNSKKERKREFDALFEWLVKRAKSRDTMYFKNMIILADLNMMFNNADTQLSDIIKKIHDLGSHFFADDGDVRVNFPFLDVHPDETQLFNTNARSNQTFDHVAFFVDPDEHNLPLESANRNAGKTNGVEDLNAYNYGVFNFVELASETLHGTNYFSLTDDQQDSLISRINDDVSDHMPIWARIPIPGAS
ncbi:MAG: hypothetical protein AAF351_06720 [Pseudomonadota bacterium]